MFKRKGKDSTKELAKAIANFQTLSKEVEDIRNCVYQNRNKLELLNHELINKNDEMLRTVGY